MSKILAHRELIAASIAAVLLSIHGQAAEAGQIHVLAANGNAPGIVQLLKTDPGMVNAPDKEGATALHWAADRGRREVAELLLAHDADIDARKKNGVTPLMVAAAMGRKELVEFLLSRGADAGATDNTQRTAVSVASNRDHQEIARIIIGFRRETLSSNTPSPSQDPIVLSEAAAAVGPPPTPKVTISDFPIIARFDPQIESMPVVEPRDVFQKPAEANSADKEPYDISGYTQIRSSSFEAKEDGGEPDRGFEIRRARMKLTARPIDRSKAIIQIDASDNEVTVKSAYATYRLDKAHEFAIGQMDWPFGYEVTNSSADREAPERALVFRRLFPGQKDRGATVEGRVSKKLAWIAGVFDGSGIDEVNKEIKDSSGEVIGEISNSVSRDYNSRKDLVGRLLWNRRDAEFGISTYIGKGIWNKKRTKLLDERKDRYGAEFRYFAGKWTAKTEWVYGRGVDESDKDFDLSEWISGYYTQLSYNPDAKNALVARYSSMSLDPNELDFGRRSAWDLGWLRWLNKQTRARFFYQANQESENPINNDGFTAEWMVVY